MNWAIVSCLVLSLLRLSLPLAPLPSIHLQFARTKVLQSHNQLPQHRLHCNHESWYSSDLDEAETPLHFSSLRSLRSLSTRLGENITYEEFRQSFDEFREIAMMRPVADKLWFNIFDACLRRQFEEIAVDMFDLMVSKYIPCSSHQLTSLLILVQEKRSYEEAMRFLDKAVAVGMEPTVHNFSPLLKACGSAKRARQILARMQLCKVEPNVISFSAAIKSCEQTGDWRSSIELLELMKAYGVAPNEITYCCIISAASKGWAGDIAVSILREMSATGIPPNQLCYACAITACARCKNWAMVEKLFYEMDELNLPIQESIIISVINCCRSSVRPPKHIYVADDFDEGSRNEWAKALWIVNRWAHKVEDLTESLYTIAMDVCLEAGRVKEVVKVYNNMLSTYKGPIKSSLSFAFRACEKLKDADVVLQLLHSAIERRMHSNAMVGSVLAFCESIGRLDAALEAYEAAYTKDMKSNRKSVPLINTRRIVRSLMKALQNDTSISHISSLELYTGLHRIIMASLKGGEIVLEYDDYYAYIRLLLQLKDLPQLRAFFRRVVRSPLSYHIMTLHDVTIETAFQKLPPDIFAQHVIDLASDMHDYSRSRTANHAVLTGMSLLYNNGSFLHSSGNFSSDPRRLSHHNINRGAIVFNLFERGRELSSLNRSSIPVRMYRIAALACRDEGMEDEILKLYTWTKEDGVLDRAVLSHCVYVLSKSKLLWAYGLEVFDQLRLLPEKPDSYMYTSALVACENGKDWRRAMSLLENMQQDGHELNTFTVTTCIAACAACGKTDEALSLLAMMIERRIECSAWTFNAAMCSCAKGGRWRDALSVFEMMRNYLSNHEEESSRSDRGRGILDAGSDGDDELPFVAEINQQMLQNTITGLASEYMDDMDSGVWDEEAERSENDEEEESNLLDYESYMASFNRTDIVTYNTLIQALGEGGQFPMVDEIYQDAVNKGIVSPLKNFETLGWIDLHFHSVHMGNAAVRYTFERMLNDAKLYNSVVTKNGELAKSITIIIGKGLKLQKAIQVQLKNDFRPSIRAIISPRNRGRLLLSSRDVQFWLRTHMAIRGSNLTLN